MCLNNDFRYIGKEILQISNMKKISNNRGRTEDIWTIAKWKE